MKLIIEVAEKYYEACKDAIKEGYPSQLEETIGKGIPVDTSGDSISREALKNDISEKVCDKFEKWNKLITLAEFETFIRDIIDNTQTVEPEITEKQAILFLINSGWLVKHDKELRDRWERPQGECRTCRHRDPEDKKCDCGELERQDCPFPVSDDYFCKFYEKGGDNT